MKEKRVLPADIYDTLELAAYAHGGIGAGSMFYIDQYEPCCIHGLLNFATTLEIAPVDMSHPANRAMLAAGIGVAESDEAVYKIRDRNNHSSPVTFKAWCRELNVVRGDK